MSEEMKRLAADLYQAYLNLQEDDGFHMAASVSFYMAVSFFPLLLVFVSISGMLLRFTGWGKNATAHLIDLVANQTSPAMADQLEIVLSDFQRQSVVGGPIGLLLLLFASMAVFVQFDDAMTRIWNASEERRRGIWSAVRSVLLDRFRAFVMLLGVGLFVLAGFIVSMTLSAIAEYGEDWIPIPARIWGLVTVVFSLTLNWTLFAVIYKTIPRVPIRWSEAARGALFSAFMWEIGRRLLAFFVIGSRFSVYGVVGAFVAVLLWIFYAMTILFLGAEYIQTFCRRCNPNSNKIPR